MQNITQGHNIKIIDAGDEIELVGLTGRVLEVFKSRGDPNVYRVKVPGYANILSFVDGEIESMETTTRKRRSDAGMPRNFVGDLA